MGVLLLVGGLEPGPPAPYIRPCHFLVTDDCIRVLSVQGHSMSSHFAQTKCPTDFLSVINCDLAPSSTISQIAPRRNSNTTSIHARFHRMIGAAHGPPYFRKGKDFYKYVSVTMYLIYTTF